LILACAKLVIAYSNDMEANSGRASGMAVAFDQLAMRARSFDQPEDQRKKKK